MRIWGAGRVLLPLAVACVLGLLSAAREPNPAAGGQATAAKPDKKGGNAADSTTFSEQVADGVLRDMADGLEAHDSRLLLSAFDAQKMAGYRAFRDQIEVLFERYEGFRVHYSVAQTAQEGGRGIVLADWEVEEIPADGVAPPQLRRGRIRFVLEHGAKGWKVVEMQPRGMFSE